MPLVSRAACQTCRCQHFSPTIFRCCKCFRMLCCRHRECDLGSTIISLLTINWQWLSESGVKERQLLRESVLNLRTNPLGVGAHNFIKYGSRVRGNRNGEQEISTVSLHNSSLCKWIWQNLGNHQVEKESEWLSHFCLSKRRERNSGSRSFSIHVLGILVC